MHNKLKKQFPFQIRFMQKLVTLCVGLFKGLYFKKYRMILNYIEADCSIVIEKYKGITYTPAEKIPKQIWTLWYDESNLKEIPKACLTRMKKLKDYKTIVLTKENLSSYIDISDIKSMLEKNIISIQFFSDIIRARVLKKYGGFWMDSTIAIINERSIDAIVQNLKFFSIKIKEFPKWQSVTEGKFSSYFWATCPNNPFFAYLDDCFTFFIKKHQAIIDYYQIDYTIMSGYEKIPFIKDLIDSIPPSNPDIFWLSGQLGKRFQIEKWKRISAETGIFKLSWRRTTPPHNPQKETYWDYLIKTWQEGE